ncbi:hypothetical protein HK102_011958, partial [Quaeritorhiza haematococci]
LLAEALVTSGGMAGTGNEIMCHAAMFCVFSAFLPYLTHEVKVLRFGNWAWTGNAEGAEWLTTQCPHVEELWMEGDPPPFTLPADYTYLFSQWQNLRVMQFSYYSEVTDAMIITLAAQCPHLERLNLSIVTYDSITDLSVTALATHCHSLKSILFHWGSSISERALLSLLASNPHLESIQFPGRLTTRTLLFAITRCKNLRHLSLEGGLLINDVVVSWIARQGRCLEAISLRSVRGFQ